QAQVDRGVVARDRGVLALAVDAIGLAADPEQLRHARGLALVRVLGLDGLAEARLRHDLDVADADAPRACTLLPERAGARRASARGVEERAEAVALRQARTAEHAEHHLAALDQRERDRVLLAAQEALRAVDRIERPVARPARLGGAAVDPGEHRVVVGRA